MSALFKNIRTCLITQHRYKFRGNKPRPSILERRVMEEVTKPLYKEQLVDDLASKCSIIKYRKQEIVGGAGARIKDNLYEQFLLTESHKILSTNHVVALCQIDSANVRRLVVIKNILMDDGLSLVILPEYIMRKAMLDSKFRNLAPLMTPHTVLIVSQDDRVLQMVKALKKIPDLHLLGGTLGDRMLTKQGLTNYSMAPPIDQQLGSLLTGLNSPAANVNHLLGCQQRRLSRLLSLIGGGV